MKRQLTYIFQYAFIVSLLIGFDSGEAFAQAPVPAVYPLSDKVNYVRSWDALAPDTDPVHLLTRPVAELHQSTEYVDGLGRTVQTVVKQISPAGKDLVNASVYDVYGREQYKYLPFVANTGASVNDNPTDGNFKLDPFQQQSSFSSGQYPGETYYYAQQNFEASPLNRPQTSLAPGASWVGASRGVGVQYLVSQVSDSVRYWTIAQAAGSIPTTVSMYPAATLYKNVTTDEQNHSVIEYKDEQGRVVLKKAQLASTPGTAHMGWACTYYVYDDLDNLRFVIQPRGVEWLLFHATWNISSVANLATELCFRYEYDYRKRMIIKMIPGAAEVWMVYDQRDRLVMTQDGNLRTAGKWVVTQYDNENRPSITGLLTDANNRTYHQNLAENSISYPSTVANFERLTQTYFDDYTQVPTGLITSLNTTYTTNSTYFNTTYNSSPIYAQAITAWNNTRGMITASQAKVLGTASQYLASVMFYDDHARMIETQSINQTGGKDTLINQYDFSGRMLRNLVRHQKAGTNAQSHSVLTKMAYDAAGRLLTVYKNIDNAGADQLILTNTYNELGQLQNKQLGNNLDNLAYAYNVRGWLTTINKDYVSGAASSNYFGMELGYDKTASVNTSTSYANPIYNGNIAGTVWKTKGDGIGRQYDFTYDNLNRLWTADFNQSNGASFNKNDHIDFSVSGMQYDLNGNIQNMTQNGFKVGGSGAIDVLTYIYQANSNKLSQVTDGANDAASKLGDFHYSGTKLATDYSYDINGNLITDNNKAISGIAYNYLNLPQTVTVTSKGSVSYTYDAGGTKLYKTTVDNTLSPAKTTLTTYIGGFVYQAASPATGGPVAADTLQFLAHEEGRARWAFHKYTTGTTAYGFEYDFFEKDHLGNTRVVLTQQKDTAQYLASMETAFRTTESLLFNNIAGTAIARTSAPGYPVDLNYTNPNDFVSKLNGSGPRVGPSLLLKVMSGDKLDISVQSFYNGTGTPNTPTPSFTDVLNSLAGGIVTMSGGAKGTTAQLVSDGGPISLYEGLNSMITNTDPNTTNKPKAYLNWILLDEQLKYVSSYPQSGAIPVGSSATLNTLAYTGLPITKNGYLYIWVSNETPAWDVFFDNLKVNHYTGPELEETHYYPFGLTMAGISSKALKPNYSENKYKFNDGTELQNKEFNDGSGLDLYATDFRSYDSQIGRFWQIDPLAEGTEDWSTYVFGMDNPILFNDPLGLDSVSSLQPSPCVPCVVHPPKPDPGKSVGPAPSYVPAPILPGTSPDPEQSKNGPVYYEPPQVYEPVTIPKSIGLSTLELGLRALGTVGLLLLPESAPGEGSHWKPFIGHGNRKDNTDPHIVYAFGFRATDGKTPMLKYGISDEFRFSMDRPEFQLAKFRAKWGPTVTYSIYARTSTREMAEFIERRLVTEHYELWNEMPREQIKPTPNP